MSAAEVREIRAMRERGLTAREVAAGYGCATETIRKIWRRETYAGVSEVATTSEQEIAESAERVAAMVRNTPGLSGPTDEAAEQAAKALLGL
jgi:transposase-like protein